MPDTLDQVTATLTEEKDKITLELTKLNQQTKELEDSLNRINQALNALGQKPSSETPRKKRKPNAKPPATQTEVSNAIADLLAGGKVLTQDQIKQAVDQQMLSSGKSRVGLAIRIKQALDDDVIEETDKGFKLQAGVST